jgi:hypothetical protein
LIPVAKTVQVISDDPGVKLNGAELEWYRVFDVTGTALLVARANVRDNGNATVLLPPPSAYSGK